MPESGRFEDSAGQAADPDFGTEAAGDSHEFRIGEGLFGRKLVIDDLDRMVLLKRPGTHAGGLQLAVHGFERGGVEQRLVHGRAHIEFGTGIEGKPDAAPDLLRDFPVGTAGQRRIGGGRGLVVDS